MSVGAAFDTYVKSHLHQFIYGNTGKDDQFDLQKLFENQVEPQNRDFAWSIGEHCFKCYKHSGALADLILALADAKTSPRFEFSIEAELQGVPLLGKPDVWFVNKDNHPVILDWKVNGACSTRPVSPTKGYVNVRDGWDYKTAKPSRNVNDKHKDAIVMLRHGMRVNVAQTLEQCSEDWAIQLSTYAWLMGASIGADFVVALDQLACAPSTTGPMAPLVRVAEHRVTIAEAFQHGVMNRYKALWEIIKSGHIFRSLDASASLRRQMMLDETYKAYVRVEGEENYEELFERG